MRVQKGRTYDRRKRKKFSLMFNKQNQNQNRSFSCRRSPAVVLYSDVAASSSLTNIPVLHFSTTLVLFTASSLAHLFFRGLDDSGVEFRELCYSECFFSLLKCENSCDESSHQKKRKKKKTRQQFYRICLFLINTDFQHI